MNKITQEQINSIDKCVKFAKWARVEMEAGRLVHTPEGDGWQPIETAPKDGRKLLMYGCHKYYQDEPTTLIQWWVSDNIGWGSISCSIIPTHWMPLPNPPEETP